MKDAFADTSSFLTSSVYFVNTDDINIFKILYYEILGYLHMLMSSI